MTMITVGLAGGCGDKLGHPAYTWDGGVAVRPPVDASADQQTEAARDASLEASDASIRDVVDAESDAGVEAGGDGDASVDGAANLREASVDGAEASDAPFDVPEATPTGETLRATLRARSPSCLSCAEANCPSELVGCSNISGIPDAGPDAGATRSQLCVEMLACYLATGCEETDPSFCYCGTALRANNICLIPTTADGKCKAQVERSFEATDPNRVLAAISSADRDTGGGWALGLMQCIRDNDCDGCFPRSNDGGTDVRADRP